MLSRLRVLPRLIKRACNFKLTNSSPKYLFSTNPTPEGPRRSEPSEMATKFKEDPNVPADKENPLEDDSSFVNENKKNYYIFIVASIGLVGGYIVMQVNSARHQKKTAKGGVRTTSVSHRGTADIGGPWELTDLEGRPFSHKNLAGSYYLIYFGFCNCPDICPVTLRKLSKAVERVKKMPEGKYVKLNTVFVSVDPDRDTKEKIRNYLALFGTEIIGVSGKSNDSDDTKSIMKKFKIYASKIGFQEEDDDNDGARLKDKKKVGFDFKDKSKAYTIDHTIITYLMDDENKYVCYLGGNLSEFEMSQKIIENILENEREKARQSL